MSWFHVHQRQIEYLGIAAFLVAFWAVFGFVAYAALSAVAS